MIFIVALILALILLGWPWNFVVLIGAAACEALIAVFGIRYTRRRRAGVGVETLIGATAEVITPLDPDGQVKVNGEIWEAHSEQGATVGKTVRVKGVHGLTLQVEPT